MSQFFTSGGQRTGHSLADRLPKDFLSLWSPIDMALDTALPTREPRPSSIHQWASNSLSYQEAFTSLWNRLTHQGADTGLSPESLDKALTRFTHQRADTRSKKTTTQHLLELSLQSQVRTDLGTSWSPDLGNKREMDCLDTGGIPYWRKLLQS